MVSSLFEGLHKYLYGEDFTLKVQGDLFFGNTMCTTLEMKKKTLEWWGFDLHYERLQL